MHLTVSNRSAYNVRALFSSLNAGALCHEVSVHLSFQCQVLYCIPTLLISGPSHTRLIWMVGGQARHYCHACLP